MYFINVRQLVPGSTYLRIVEQLHFTLNLIFERFGFCNVCVFSVC